MRLAEKDIAEKFVNRRRPDDLTESLCLVTELLVTETLAGSCVNCTVLNNYEFHILIELELET